MSEHDPKLVEMIERSGSKLSPRSDWQDSVHRRIRLATNTQQPQKSRIPGLVFAAALASVVSLVVMFKLNQQGDAAAKQDKVAMVEEIKRLSDEIDQAQLEIAMAQAKLDQAFDDLEAAQSEAAKAVARAARQAAHAELVEKRAALGRLNRVARGTSRNKNKAKAKSKKSRSKSIVDRCAKSNDPLCGL